MVTPQRRSVTPATRPVQLAEMLRRVRTWLGKLMLESYEETRHQPKFSALIALKTASINSRSFRRMVHAVETLAG